VQEIVVAAGQLPVIAIGGIHPGQVAAVMATGAYGIALLSAVWGAEDPGQIVTSLLDRIGESLQTSGNL
jgi:thiamine monophosphate synthase